MKFAKPLGAGLAAFAIMARVLWPGDAAGWGLNMLLDAVALLAAAIVFVGEDRLRAAPAAWALGGLGAWALLSSFWASEGLPAVSTASSWIAAAALAAACVQSARDTAIHAAVAAAAMQAGYAIWQYFLGLAQVQAEYRADPYQLRFTSALERAEFEARLFTREAFGTFATSNLLCAFVAILLPLVVGRILDAKSTRSRACLAPVAAALLFAAALSKSKGGLIAIGAAAAVFAWRVFAPDGKRRLQLGIAGLVASVVIGAGLLAAHPGPFDWTNPKTSFGYRANYAKGSLGVIKEAPVLGVGASNWGAHYTAHMTPTAGEAQRAHFDILQVLGELGPIGLALFLAVCILAFAFQLRTPNSELPTPPTGTAESKFPWPAALGVCLAIAFNELLDHRVTQTGWFAPAILALITAAIAGSSEAPIGRFTKAGALAGAAGFFVHGLVEYDLYVPGLVFALAVCLGFSAGVELSWRGRLAAAIPALAAIPLLVHAGPFMQADTTALEAKSGKVTLEQIREAKDQNPYDPDLPIAEANVIHASKGHKPDDCLPAFDAAIRLAPSQSGLFQQRALAKEAHQDLPGALKDWDRAIELYPNSAKLRLMRGRAREASKVDGWREDYQKALELSPQADMPRRALTEEEIRETRAALGR